MSSIKSVLDFHELQPMAMDVNYEGSLAVLASRRWITVVDLNSGVKLKRLNRNCRWESSVCLWPAHGTNIVTTNNQSIELYEWYGAGASQIYPRKQHRRPGDKSNKSYNPPNVDPGMGVSMSPDELEMIVGVPLGNPDSDIEIRKSSASSGPLPVVPTWVFKQIRSLWAHSRMILDVDWSIVDVNMFASAADCDQINIWDARDTRKPARSIQIYAMNTSQIKWNKLEEHFLASAHDGDIRLWDDRNLGAPLSHIVAHLNRINALDWDPSVSNHLLSAGQDGGLKIWNTHGLSTPMTEATVKLLPIWKAKFSPGGECIASVPIPSIRQMTEAFHFFNAKELSMPPVIRSGQQNMVLDFAFQRIATTAGLSESGSFPDGSGGSGGSGSCDCNLVSLHKDGKVKLMSLLSTGIWPQSRNGRSDVMGHDRSPDLLSGWYSELSHQSGSQANSDWLMNESDKLYTGSGTNGSKSEIMLKQVLLGLSQLKIPNLKVEKIDVAKNTAGISYTSRKHVLNLSLRIAKPSPTLGSVSSDDKRPDLPERVSKSRSSSQTPIDSANEEGLTEKSTANESSSLSVVGDSSDANATQLQSPDSLRFTWEFMEGSTLSAEHQAYILQLLQEKSSQETRQASATQQAVSSTAASISPGSAKRFASSTAFGFPIEQCLIQLPSLVEKLEVADETEAGDFASVVGQFARQSSVLASNVTHHHLGFHSNQDSKIPFPRTSGGRFSGPDRLVCFGRLLSTRSNNLDKLVIMDKTPRAMSGLLAMSKKPSTSGMSMVDHSSGSYLSIKQSTSVVSDSPGFGMIHHHHQFSAPSQFADRPSFYSPSSTGGSLGGNGSGGSSGGGANRDRTASLKRYNKKRDLMKPQRSSISSSAGTREFSVVYLYDTEGMLPIRRELAKRYCLAPNDAFPTREAVCFENARVALSVDRKDLFQMWNVLGYSTSTNLKPMLDPNVATPWSVNPLGRALVYKCINTYARIGDLQTLATIASVVGEQKVVRRLPNFLEKHNLPKGYRRVPRSGSESDGSASGSDGFYIRQSSRTSVAKTMSNLVGDMRAPRESVYFDTNVNPLEGLSPSQFNAPPLKFTTNDPDEMKQSNYNSAQLSGTQIQNNYRNRSCSIADDHPSWTRDTSIGMVYSSGTHTSQERSHAGAGGSSSTVTSPARQSSIVYNTALLPVTADLSVSKHYHLPTTNQQMYQQSPPNRDRLYLHRPTGLPFPPALAGIELAEHPSAAEEAANFVPELEPNFCRFSSRSGADIESRPETYRSAGDAATDASSFNSSLGSFVSAMGGEDTMSGNESDLMTLQLNCYDDKSPLLSNVEDPLWTDQRKHDNLKLLIPEGVMRSLSRICGMYSEFLYHWQLMNQRVLLIKRTRSSAVDTRFLLGETWAFKFGLCACNMPPYGMFDYLGIVGGHPQHRLLTDPSFSVPIANSINSASSGLTSLMGAAATSFISTATGGLVSGGATSTLNSDGHTTASLLPPGQISLGAVSSVPVLTPTSPVMLPSGMTGGGAADCRLPIANTARCQRCTRPSVTCSVCQSGTIGMVTLCICCGHGGHLAHLQTWFEDALECATPWCNCHCSFWNSAGGADQKGFITGNK